WPELRGIEPTVVSKERLGDAKSRVALGLAGLVGAGAGGLVVAIASYGFKAQVSPFSTALWLAAGVVAAAGFLVVRPTLLAWVTTPITTRRGAAIAAGWVVIAGLAPGAWVLSGKIGNLAATVRVAVFSIVVGIAVFAAIELVYRRMTRGMRITTSRPQIESI